MRHWLVLFLACGLTSPHSAARPNILVFLADDLGIGDVGAFGNTTVRTPHVDGVCEQGVRLDHDVAAAPVCTPSRTALFTARYPIRTGEGSTLVI